MCGFTGYIQLKNKQSLNKVINQMLETIHHRGPDDEGILYFSLEKQTYEIPTKNYNSTLECAIGFKRLSIVDLSPNGHQPMISSDNKTIIVFNGEVYNAFDYREELENKGFVFKSKTDTEIVLNLYKAYGIKGLVDRIVGMFAIVIVDLSHQKIYFIRDHFGIKPFYYYVTDNEILFSSEIKSFYQYPHFKAEFNKSFLTEFLYYKYVSHPHTLLKNVFQLPPATYLEISKTEKKQVKFWNYKATENKNISYNDALYEIDYLLKKSVKSQLMGDVKIGCQLSGGIDSSLITNYAREYFDANMDTFSIIFDDARYSEQYWIDQVNKKTQSDSHLFLFTENYFFRNLYTSTWHLEQPLHLPNTIAIKLLSENSKPYVTVLLSGEGADELFGGYTRFYDVFFRNTHEKLLKLIAKFYLSKKINEKYKLQQEIAYLCIESSAVMSKQLLNLILPENNLNEIIEKRKTYLPQHDQRIITNMSIYEMQTYMTDLLIRQDKMTMAHSLENRVPFLDKNLVEYILTLPDEYKLIKPSQLLSYNKYQHSTKRLLKDLAIQKFNKDFVYRAKSGFALPLSDYFKTYNFLKFIKEKLLVSLANRNICNKEGIIYVLEKFEQGNNSFIKNIWQLLALELWLEIFIDKKSI